MTKDEALKLALEALQAHGAAYLYHELRYEEAITVINEALAQPAQASMAKPTPESTPEELEKIMLEVWQPAQPAQESDDIAARMSVVADEFAHKMALDLECILYEYSGKWYDAALNTLEAYRTAMRDIHESVSPTHMGEPVLQSPDWIKYAIPPNFDAAQPAQEPVAMRYDYDGYGYKYIDSGSGSDWQTRIKDAEPIYAIPSQRPAAVGEDKKEWVRLTDDDIHEAYLKHRDMDDYARMIQAKLKEKNT